MTRYSSTIDKRPYINDHIQNTKHSHTIHKRPSVQYNVQYKRPHVKDHIHNAIDKRPSIQYISKRLYPKLYIPNTIYITDYTLYIQDHR